MTDGERSAAVETGIALPSYFEEKEERLLQAPPTSRTRK
jgi:hypothetical protein